MNATATPSKPSKREPMTFEQRLARAMQKASEQRAHVMAVPGRPGIYRVKSAEDPKDSYIVTEQWGKAYCSCKSAEYGHPCWHACRLEMRLARENLIALRAANRD